MSTAQGCYSDGRSAAGMPVTAAIDADGLAITAADGMRLAVWPLAELRIVSGARGDATLLACYGGDERLTVWNAVWLGELQARCPDLHRSPYCPSIGAARIGIWASGAIAGLALFFLVLLPLGAQQFAANLPAHVEKRMGNWVADALIAYFGEAAVSRGEDPLCNDRAATAALTQLVARLSAGGSFAIKPRVQVINSDLVNAFATPGGRIFVLRGLIDDARSPNEFAAVLAHELAHAELRHPTETALKSAAAAFVVGLFLGDASGFSIGTLLGQWLVQTSYSRDAEAAADVRAVELMARADLDVAPLADFFDRLSSKYGDLDGMLAYVNTHPASTERAAAVRALAGRGGGPALSQAEWRSLKRICN